MREKLNKMLKIPVFCFLPIIQVFIIDIKHNTVRQCIWCTVGYRIWRGRISGLSPTSYCFSPIRLSSVMFKISPPLKSDEWRIRICKLFFLHVAPTLRRLIRNHFRFKIPGWRSSGGTKSLRHIDPVAFRSVHLVSRSRSVYTF
mgnify:CR=1 FL=1